jgi:hypothetical protein
MYKEKRRRCLSICIKNMASRCMNSGHRNPVPTSRPPPPSRAAGQRDLRSDAIRLCIELVARHSWYCGANGYKLVCLLGRTKPGLSIDSGSNLKLSRDKSWRAFPAESREPKVYCTQGVDCISQGRGKVRRIF